MALLEIMYATRGKTASMNGIIDKIIQNFASQHRLYSRMYELACLQLDILQGEAPISGSEKVQVLLSQRQDILASIMLLNDDNKRYQAQAIEAMGLKRFVLSELKVCMDQRQYTALQGCIADLGSLLEKINEVDKQNQRVMESGGPSGKKATSRQAQNAYRSAMENKKRDI